MSPHEIRLPALALVICAGPQGTPFTASIDTRSTLARMASLGQLSLLPHVGERSAAALSAWEVSLLDALGLSERRNDLPSAAVCYCGDSQTIPAASEYWAHLTCVHFAAGMNDVAGSILAGDSALDEQDRAELAATLAAHLAADRYELHAASGGQWHVRCPRALEVQTLPPDVAFEAPLKEALPSGADAAELRRLMTEMQMLLHEHPVNVRRARAQQLPANACWMWSVANLRAAPSAALPAAFGGESYLKGLYRLHSQTVRAESFDAATLRDAARASPYTIAVVRPNSAAALETDWLRPLFDAVRAGSFAQLVVYYDRWRLALRRRDLLRFWRAPLPLSAWPV